MGSPFVKELIYQVRADETGTADNRTAYLWIVPAKVDGNWKLEGVGELVLKQNFQKIDGTLGGKYATAEALAGQIAAQWPAAAPGPNRRLVVLTGGEPLLQVDGALVDALHAQGFEIAVETNGTVLPPAGLDWVCVSPKAGSTLLLRQGQELKVVVPQPGLDLDQLAELPFAHHFLQAMDGPLARENTAWATAHCLADPRWRLSVQTHKVLGIR